MVIRDQILTILENIYGKLRLREYIKMKKTKLRKHTLRPIERLKKDADESIQKFYRAKYPTQKCEADCGRLFNVMHHPIPKSLSARLRYTDHTLNLVFLCSPCHFAHHRRGDPHIHATIIARRGQQWYDNLNKIRREYLDINNRKFLMGVLEKYSIML